jgi:methionyl-tRNA formyltransferase
MLRVGFAGTPEFAAVARRAIHGAGQALPLVLTQPDRPAGRGLKLTASPVKQLGLTLGARIAQPRSLRFDGKFPEDARTAADALAEADIDVLVVAAYGLILPAWVLALPRLGCLNIHASLLPRWRGAAPIHRAIEAGDACTGITVMQMDEGLDTGAMLLREELRIGPRETTATLHDRLAARGGRLIVEALGLAARGALDPQPQPDDGVCYAHKIDKAEAALDWQAPAALLERRVRAFDPFPGAHFAVGGETVKVWRADAVGASEGLPGLVVSCSADRFAVRCGVGALEVSEVQRPGGIRQAASAFLLAHPGLLGAQLSSSPGLQRR